MHYNCRCALSAAVASRIVSSKKSPVCPRKSKSSVKALTVATAPHDHLGAKPFASFHKLQMLRMVVISIFRLLGLKLNVQSDLITLIHDTAMALRHPADVKTNNARNGRKVFLCVSDNYEPSKLRVYAISIHAGNRYSLSHSRLN